MAKIKPYWWLPVGLFFVLGLVSALPGNQESLVGYQALSPLFPVSLAAFWFLAWLSFKVGLHITQRGLR